MKTIEEAVEEYSKTRGDRYGRGFYWGNEPTIGFKAGVEFAQQWISVEEELPAHQNMVLILYENDLEKLNAVDTAYYNHTYNAWDGQHYAHKITHWRPIEFE